MHKPTQHIMNPTASPPALRPLTRSNYHQHPGVGSTLIKAANAMTSRMLWQRYLKPDRRPFVPNEGMRQGSLVDCLITEPAQYKDRYIMQPDDLPKRPTAKQLSTGQSSKPGTKARADWEDAQLREKEWQAFLCSVGDREVISSEWERKAFRTVDALKGSTETAAVIKHFETQRNAGTITGQQQPFQWLDKQYGWFKYMPDIETESLYDLKKTRSADAKLSQWQALQLGYDIQIAHYLEGSKARTGWAPTVCGFIFYEWPATEGEIPDVCLRPCEDDFITYGKDRRHKALAKLQKTIGIMSQPTYGGPDPMDLASCGVVPIGLPDALSKDQITQQLKYDSPVLY